MQTDGSAPRTISRLRHLNWGIDNSVLSTIGASLSESQNVLNGSAACMLYVLCMYVCMYICMYVCMYSILFVSPYAGRGQPGLAYWTIYKNDT